MAAGGVSARGSEKRIKLDYYFGDASIDHVVVALNEATTGRPIATKWLDTLVIVTATSICVSAPTSTVMQAIRFTLPSTVKPSFPPENWFRALRVVALRGGVRTVEGYRVEERSETSSG